MYYIKVVLSLICIAVSICFKNKDFKFRHNIWREITSSCYNYLLEVSAESKYICCYSGVVMLFPSLLNINISEYTNYYLLLRFLKQSEAASQRCSRRRQRYSKSSQKLTQVNERATIFIWVYIFSAFFQFAENWVDIKNTMKRMHENALEQTVLTYLVQLYFVPCLVVILKLHEYVS